MNLSVLLLSQSLTPILEGSLGFGFVQPATDLPILLVGYESYPLKVMNEPDKAEIIGLGYVRMRTHAFAYLGAELLFDTWANKTPFSVIDGFVVPMWSIVEGRSSHSGPISLDNVSQLTQVGYKIEFENLTVCFNDDSSFLCGPTNLTLGVNFTQEAGIWSFETILESSSAENVAIDERRVLITLQHPVPPSPEATGPHVSTILFGWSESMSAMLIINSIVLSIVIAIPALVILKKLWTRSKQPS